MIDLSDLTAVKSALRAQRIETPSWAFANSGTRFKVFPQAGVPPLVAEITPVEPDPGNAGEGRHVEDAPQWGIEPVPEQLRQLGT